MRKHIDTFKERILNESIFSDKFLIIYQIINYKAIANLDYMNKYKGEEKIGFLVISTDRYEHYNFDELLNGKVIYLNFIRLHEKGFLRQVISKLKDKVKDNYDYIVLEISGQSYDQFKELETKYKNIGFTGILPDDISEYNLGLPEGIDPYEDNIFMYTEV